LLVLPRLLLDTHVAVRWLIDPKKLSREQFHTLKEVTRRAEPVTLSALSLLEMAVLSNQGRLKLKTSLAELFEDLQANPLLRVLPLTYEIAQEVASMGSALTDPADRAIVATARVHRLRLVTSDQRIIESKLVSVLE
jgi:PIN domain nuclease of toxin-antitoxin system